MNAELTPLLAAANAFGWLSGICFTAAGIYLSVRGRRLHPLLLLCICAISFSWIEAPYDWAMYAQFPPGLPRMPSWWPLNMTWGGLPSSVPLGYIGYFCIPAVTGAALGRHLSDRFNWRRPITLLIVGLVVGFCWALLFNGGLGAQVGVFYYGYVIPGLALFEGSIHQYPVYDAIAMGIQMMVFAYLLGRTDANGRNVIEMFAEKVSKTRAQSVIVSVVSVIVVGNVLYGAVFAPHLVTKQLGYVTAGPDVQLFPGVPNQPR
ncbi:spirocyclase AveC family protein [Mycobacterium sp. IDR2000157661]|uniref:spirocyclase AveC family protein n=1 Tax=Mycobacterium sp. IDR2000157661 TaxID=2867005 RepID=UPI001EEBAF96|nr:spirocyclase AveC family protein [Mycobacterium sp. IDR2000157661]ULE33115.1 spirocyclase AveC family protein [Mycobacterium sp. IDR2000157661]